MILSLYIILKHYSIVKIKFKYYSRLKCQICISPNDIYIIETSFDWYYNSTINKTQFNIPIDTSEHIIISTTDASLYLFDVQTEQEGFYWCQFKSTISSPWYLNIANDTEPIIQVKSDEAINAQHAIPPVFIKHLNIKIYSHWSDWTPCSNCDIVGIKKRFGYCTISLDNYQQHIRKKKQGKLSITKLEKLILN